MRTCIHQHVWGVAAHLHVTIHACTCTRNTTELSNSTTQWPHLPFSSTLGHSTFTRDHSCLHMHTQHYRIEQFNHTMAPLTIFLHPGSQWACSTATASSGLRGNHLFSLDISNHVARRIRSGGPVQFNSKATTNPPLTSGAKLCAW